MSHAAAASRDTIGPAPSQTQSRRRSLVRPLLMGGGLLLIAAGSLTYWLNGGRWIETDDAYVQADTMTLSTDVSGLVSDIPVHEGQAVKQGDVLFRLDPEKFQIALDNAQANLAETRLSLEAMKSDYQARISDAASRQQQVNADQATYDRLAGLVKAHAVTQQETDDARYKLASDQQALQSATMQAKAELAKLGGNADAAVEQMPAYRQAQAEVAERKREMDHATVRAPYSGIVTQVSKLQKGMYLGASAAAFGLVSTDHVWVEAQPKETQLTYAKPGDHVEVTFDIYPGRTWDGVVESIAPATDQQFSLLPAQNSSGNWVKAVQRLPVRVRVDRRPGDPPLRAGMSADIDIDTGHTRTLADLF
jgi:membrane fusion protein, multidrug efflux system